MHSYGETTANVPAFLIKLLRLVDDEDTNNLISWTSDGRSFVIRNQAKFAKELLPLNYKHNNMASFIRQLNMYGFHKITSIDNGGLKFDKDEMEFSHPCFQKGQPYLLEHIKRKIANPKINPEDKTVKNIEAVNNVLNEVKSMRGRQESLDSRFSSMKQENEALWREIAMLRQKHLKQQQIVNKLIQFLVTMVQPTRSGLGGMGSGKRRIQLMINDAPQASKIKKINDESAIISEFGEELLDEVQSDPDQDPIISDIPQVQSPDSLSNHSSSIIADENIDEVDGSNDMNDINEFIDTQAPQYKYVIRSNNNNNNNNIDLDNEVNEIVTPLMKKALANKKKQSKTYIQSKRRNQNYNNNDMDNIMIKIEKDDDSIQTTTRPQIRTKTKTAPTSTMSNDNIQNKNHNKRKTMKPGKSLLNTNEDQGQIKKQKYQDNEIDDGIEYIDYDYEMPQATADIIENTLLDSNNDSPIISSPKKTLYNKETFFNADMPNELFGDDSNPNIEMNSSPLISDFNLEASSYNPTVSFGKESVSDDSPADISPASTSTLQSQSNELQVAKFNSQTLAKPSENMLKMNTPSDFDYHLDSVQNDLDTLKDLLRGEGYQFDANTLLGQVGDASSISLLLPPSTFDPDLMTKLFGNEDVLPYELTLPNDLPEDKRLSENGNLLQNQNTTGAELMAYNPVQVDLSELLDMDDGGGSAGTTDGYPDNINYNVLNTPVTTPKCAPSFKQFAK